MYAVVFNVEMKQDWEGDTDQELDMIVAMTKESPGFVRGTWAGNDGHGVALVVLDSEENAKAMAEGAFIPPEASVTLQSAAWYAVEREA